MLKDIPTLYNIPAGLPFADCLAAGILELYGHSPDILAQTTIFLPSKRGIRALQDAFLKRRKGRLLMLPSLRALGDGLDEEPSLLAENDMTASHILTQKQVLSGGVRQLVLTRMILEHIRKKEMDMSYPEAFALAVSMIGLLDSLQSERITFEELKNIDVGSYAKAWQDNVRILHVMTDIWPEFISQKNFIDPAPYRNAVLETLTQSWTNHPPQRPIIAAGSTGSMPASADFMKLIAHLPQGCVVLPGYDDALSQRDKAFLTADHPQFGLNNLVNHIAPNNNKPIPHWTSAKKFLSVKHDAKKRFFHELMRPSATAEEWFNIKKRISHDDIKHAIDGLKIISAPSEREEATAIALIMRETLETPHKTAALITPNRMLARRVKTELARWNIIPDDSAGIPLSDMPQGIFCKLLCDVIETNLAPVALLAFLKHPFVTMGMKSGYFKRPLRALEDDLLRGPTPPEGIDGLRQYLQSKINNIDKGRQSASELKERLTSIFNTLNIIEETLKPLLYMPDKSTMKDFITALISVINKITLKSNDTGETFNRFWSDDSGKAMESMFLDFANHSDLLGYIPVPALRGHLMEFTAKIPIRQSHGISKRLFIWGTPEARLQQTDHIILGGLTEGSWPISPDTGIWLSRTMRSSIGLSAPERRIGLSAHDLVQAACAPKVFLTHALKSDGSPLIPSRWLIRLENIIKGLFDSQSDLNLMEQLKDRKYLKWASNLDKSDITLPPAKRPMPTPPAAVRPRKLSVTAIDTWIRDPYSIYAEHILNLRQKDPLHKEKAAADRGTMMHSVLQHFMEKEKNNISAKSQIIMDQIITDHIMQHNGDPSITAFWRPRLKQIGTSFIKEEIKKHKYRKAILLEGRGQISFQTQAGEFILTARVDRIDRTNDNSLVIIDYKSSETSAASNKQVASGISPQIPLQAYIAQNGGFETINAAPVTGGEYIVLTGKKAVSYETLPIIPPKNSHCALFQDITNHVSEGFISWVNRFDDEKTPYTSHFMPQYIKFEGHYDHLARVQEWSVHEEE